MPNEKNPHICVVEIEKCKVQIMSHISLGQRYKIEGYLQINLKRAQIAKEIGLPKKTVNQEIKRNSNPQTGIYKAEEAHQLYLDRMQKKRKAIHFTEEIKERVTTLLKEDYSPEQIAGTLKNISHQTIYKFVWNDKKKGGSLYKHLRNQGKRYQRKEVYKSNDPINDRKSIDLRPAIVEQRSRIGDYEVDLVMGANHKGAILTFNDRATGYTLLGHLPCKGAIHTKEMIAKLITENQLTIHTITSDNGKEFSKHKELSEEFNLDYYFAHPYHSWERGSNENYNRLLRQYFPKGADLRFISQEELERVQNKLNNRPRKRFGYMSPKQVYLQAIKNQGNVNLLSNNQQNKKLPL